MKRSSFIALLFFMVGLLAGCAKPDHITTVKSPLDGLFYTTEDYYNHGPVSDTNRVYANLERDGKADRVLLLEGENLTVAKITWNSPHDATICLDGGITSTFRNEVTLTIGSTSETVHNHLQEHCDATPRTSNR
jgi:hypothetical protein